MYKEADKELLHGMNHLIDKDMASISETAECALWMKETSRGRLIYISQEGQQVFVAIEMSVRTYLRVTNAQIK